MNDTKKPNVLLLLSDQERQRDWLPSSASLPARERLRREGLELTRYHTHSSPCSPSRASLFTGLYVPQHGVTENVIFPPHPKLDSSIRTLGHRFRDAGYRTSYLGKWHLDVGPSPDMEARGFSDWRGNDQHFMGWAGTGLEFDPMITDQACAWLRDVAPQESKPWFLSVALVNPHDVMWFPADQPDYQAAHPAEIAEWRSIMRMAAWKDGDPIPPFTGAFEEVFDTLPPSFADTLEDKPAVQRAWMDCQQASFWGRIDPSDRRAWLRQLDYYYALHRIGDANLARILAALDETNGWDDTIVVFTSDHGDMCGSHGLRSKGPFVYDEIVRVPLYVRAPGRTTAGTTSEALATHVDLARTLVELAGADADGMAGRDLSPVLADPSQSVQDSVLIAQEQSWYSECIPLRWACRALYDGRYKYARYFGCGGGYGQLGQPSGEPMRVGPDAPFEEQEHELYDRQEDPHEMRNLAADPAYAPLVRELFGRLKDEEQRAFQPQGATAG